MRYVTARISVTYPSAEASAEDEAAAFLDGAFSAEDILVSARRHREELVVEFTEEDR
jgi:hypothetical protein